MKEFTASHAAQLVSAFDVSGIHRVGTPGDFASGEWLEGEAVATGAAVTRMPVAVNRTVVHEAYIDCAGQRIDGLPMFDSPPTSETGIQGAFAANGSAGDVGYLDLPPNSASIKHMKFETIRRETQHAALVVATRVTGESLAPINAQYFDAPFGPPILLVAGAHHALLEAQARNNAAVKIVSAHRREKTQSYNIAARVASGNSAAAPLAVVTPRTGWWESTAERAGGLVAWLAAIASATALHGSGKLKRDVRAYATCGHELGHLGLTELLAREAGLVQGAHHWLHLGANLGCASNLTLFLRAHDPVAADRMRELLCAEGYPAAHIRVEPISAVSGEGHDITEQGGKVLSMAGANAHFHAASDRWPGNVNAAGTAAIARAVGNWVTLNTAS
ncbi:MAG: hypothetical protein ABIS45_18575 [Burkholderiales bacterium]